MKAPLTPGIWAVEDAICRGATRTDLPHVGVWRGFAANSLWFPCAHDGAEKLTVNGYRTMQEAMAACERIWPPKHQRVTVIVPVELNPAAIAAAAAELDRLADLFNDLADAGDRQAARQGARIRKVLARVRR